MPGENTQVEETPVEAGYAKMPDPPAPSMTQGNDELMPHEGESLDQYRARIDAYYRERTKASPGEPLAVFIVRVREIAGEKEHEQQARIERIKEILMAEEDILDAALTYGTPKSGRDKDAFGQETRRRVHEFVRQGWPISPKIIEPIARRHPDHPEHK